MREILFRAKRVGDGEWIYGSFIPDLLEMFATTDEQKEMTDWGFIKPFGRTKEERMMREVERYSVGQYTGLTDKNGVKIFEGDIVKTGYSNEDEWFEVRYGICGGTKNVLHEVGYMGFYLHPVNEAAKELSSHGARDDIVYWAKREEGVEVIGSIYDNPELLKGGAE